MDWKHYVTIGLGLVVVVSQYLAGALPQYAAAFHVASAAASAIGTYFGVTSRQLGGGS